MTEFAEDFREICEIVAFVALSGAFLILVYRIAAGPTTPDRVLALDLIIAVAIGFIAAFGISTGFTVYVDIALALGLIGFLSTVALARFVLQRGRPTDDLQERLGRAPLPPRVTPSRDVVGRSEG